MAKWNNLSILPQNKTVIFSSPLDGKDILVRTGTSQENTPFINALLHSHSKDYVKMDETEREKFAKKFIKSISDSLNTKKWQEASADITVKIPFQENITKIVEDFYRFANDKRPKSSMGKKIFNFPKENRQNDVYKVLCELIPLEIFQKEVLEIAASDKSIEETGKIIQNNIKEYTSKILASLRLEKEKKEKILEKQGEIFSKIISASDKDAFKAFLVTQKRSIISVDHDTIQILCERLNRNIYFLDSRTRMPYIVDPKSENKRKKNIIVMWMGGAAYEIVGKLLPEQRIQREFLNDDPLIKRINVFLYKPELVKDLYPELLPYLSEEQTEKIKDTKDKSQSEESQSQESSESEESKSEESESEENKSEESESESSKSKESRKKTPKLLERKRPIHKSRKRQDKKRDKYEKRKHKSSSKSE